MSAPPPSPTSTWGAIAQGNGLVSIGTVALPPVGPHDVIIDVSYAGICGSDLHGIDQSGTLGFTPGHEFSGVVSGVGGGVDGVGIGDRVAVLPRLACGRCRSCRRSDPVHCTNYIRTQPGGWAAQVVRDVNFLRPVPASVSLRDAALTEPLSCALWAVEKGAVTAGDTVVVLGGGSIGLMASVLSMRSGAAQVLVSEPRAERRRTAALLSLPSVDPTTQDARAAVDALTGGFGADVVIEAVGSAAVVEEALAMVKRGGRVVVAGVASPGDTMSLDVYDLFARELTISGAWGVEATFQRSLELLPYLPTDDLVSDVFPLEEVQQAVDLARQGSSGKVMLQIGED